MGRTANFFADGEQLTDREFGPFNATDNRPLAFKFDSSGYDVGEILYRGEGDTVIITAI